MGGGGEKAEGEPARVRRGEQRSAAARPYPAPQRPRGTRAVTHTRRGGNGRQAHALLTGSRQQAAGEAGLGSGDGSRWSSTPSRRRHGPGAPRCRTLPVSPRPYAKMAPRARRPRWKSNADSSMGSALALRRRLQGESGWLSAESSIPGTAVRAARGGRGSERDGAASSPLAAGSGPRRASSPIQPCVCGARSLVSGLGCSTSRAGAEALKRGRLAAAMARACSASSLPRGGS